MKRLISVSALILSIPWHCWAWNPITDIRDNLQWKFGQAAEAGIAVKLTGAGDLEPGDTATSALFSIADYRFLTFSYGGIRTNKEDAKTTDTFKVGLRVTKFFDFFANKPTLEMEWMRNLNVGPAISSPIIARSHPVTLFIEANYLFGGNAKTTTP